MRTQQIKLIVYSLAITLAFGHRAGSTQEKTPTLDELKARSITTASGKVGELLRQWWKEGTAAGNIGDFYDNRDGAHSDLNTSPYPQLQRIVYKPEEIKARLHWAAARMVRPGVVFGNSSTSAPPHLSGSNPRSYYASPGGVDFLYKQYRGNNLYIYPEHRDHDPARSGPDEGYGDLYPTNTPYLIISQGSSGSDQPFMRAVPFTLAAFRPEVKTKLVELGLLMPTVQMILRSTSKGLKSPEEYLTGKAHPTVFEGSQVDDVAMIQKAHGITLDTLPPLVQLSVMKEESPVHGRDYFEPGAREQWADTPGVIARIWRGKDKSRTMLVSAEKSFDVNKKPLKYHWVLLRGDPKRVRITPKKDDGSVAELTVEYHERLPIGPGAAMDSNRVDIGVFVHNGHYFSAPAFVTFFSLDSEARTYDEKGRILEIGSGVHDTLLDVKDWPALFRFLKEKSPRRGLLPFDALAKEDWKVLEQVELEMDKATPEKSRLEAHVKSLEADQQTRNKAKATLQTDLKTAEGKKETDTVETIRKKLANLDIELKKGEATLNDARKPLQKISQDLRLLVTQPIKGMKRSANDIVREVIEKAKPGMLEVSDEMLDPVKAKRLEGERKRLSGLGLTSSDKKGFSFAPLRKGEMTPFEKSQMERYLGVLMGEVLFADFLQVRLHRHLVDPRLQLPREWRDVYRYDDKGNYLGWIRWAGGKRMEFNRDGHLVLERDRLGRAFRAEGVVYRAKGGPFGPGPYSLEMSQTGETFTYEFRDDEDRIGMVKSRTK